MYDRNKVLRDLMYFIFSWFHGCGWKSVVLVFLITHSPSLLLFVFSSVILLVNSRCSSLMLNHFINPLIILFTSILLHC